MTPAMLTAQFSKWHPASGGPSFTLDVSIEAPAGFTILFGSSGAGKSTLLDCLAGIARPDTGKIVLSNASLFDSSTGANLPPQKRNLAYVFQTLALFPHLTVESNVAFGLSHLSEAERHSRVTEILQLFRVDHLCSRKPAMISSGERQRVALARSLVTNPQALLLDEPLVGLDAGLKSAIVNDLRTWNASRQIPILYVTHSREEVDALGERVIALENGRVVGSGAPREVLDAPRNRQLAYAIGFENILEATVLELRPSDGVMRAQLGSSACEIEVPLVHASPGDHLHVAVRAGDILLATAKPVQFSARNILEGNLESLEQRGSIVVAQVNCGAPFVVHITPSAVRSLALAPGQKVWLVLKTHSCHLV
jgi:molybdate transport system ATP-binding protein